MNEKKPKAEGQENDQEDSEDEFIVNRQLTQDEIDKLPKQLKKIRLERPNLPDMSVLGIS